MAGAGGGGLENPAPGLLREKEEAGVGSQEVEGGGRVNVGVSGQRFWLRKVQLNWGYGLRF